jgi:hypothetical protein
MMLVLCALAASSAVASCPAGSFLLLVGAAAAAPDPNCAKLGWYKPMIEDTSALGYMPLPKALRDQTLGATELVPLRFNKKSLPLMAEVPWGGLSVTEAVGGKARVAGAEAVAAIGIAVRKLVGFEVARHTIATQSFNAQLAIDAALKEADNTLGAAIVSEGLVATAQSAAEKAAWAAIEQGLEAAEARAKAPVIKALVKTLAPAADWGGRYLEKLAPLEWNGGTEFDEQGVFGSSGAAESATISHSVRASLFQLLHPKFFPHAKMLALGSTEQLASWKTGAHDTAFHARAAVGRADFLRGARKTLRHEAAMARFHATGDASVVPPNYASEEQDEVASPDAPDDDDAVDAEYYRRHTPTPKPTPSPTPLATAPPTRAPDNVVFDSSKVPGAHARVQQLSALERKLTRDLAMANMGVHLKRFVNRASTRVGNEVLQHAVAAGLEAAKEAMTTEVDGAIFVAALEAALEMAAAKIEVRTSQLHAALLPDVLRAVDASAAAFSKGPGELQSVLHRVFVQPVLVPGHFCARCPAGKYVPQVGRVACYPCTKQGHAVNEQRTRCDEGPTPVPTPAPTKPPTPAPTPAPTPQATVMKHIWNGGFVDEAMKVKRMILVGVPAATGVQRAVAHTKTEGDVVLPTLEEGGRGIW